MSTRRVYEYGVFQGNAETRCPLWMGGVATLEKAEDVAKSLASADGHAYFVFDFVVREVAFWIPEAMLMPCQTPRP